MAMKNHDRANRHSFGDGEDAQPNYNASAYPHQQQMNNVRSGSSSGAQQLK